MAIRTDSTAVAALLGANYDSDISLDRFIGIASRLLDRVVACAALKNITFSTEELADLEGILAAHFYQMTDEGFTSKQTGKASGTVKGQFASGLQRTTFGQTALMLDPSGCLASLSSGARAGSNWIGKSDSEKIPYRNRN